MNKAAVSLCAGFALAFAATGAANAMLTDKDREILASHDMATPAGEGDQQTVWFMLQGETVNAQMRRDAFHATVIGLSPMFTGGRVMSQEQKEQMLTLILRHTESAEEKQLMLDDALDMLAMGSNLEMTRYILQLGANPNSCSPQLSDAYNIKMARNLSDAALNPKVAPQMTALLLAYGADPQATLPKFEDTLDRFKDARELLIQKSFELKHRPVLSPAMKP